MSDVTFTTVTNGDTSIEVAVQGDGPLLLCVHGWPELWYSWRHQMAHFSANGWKVAAPNVRGYGNSSNPTDVASYTLRELAGDMAAVIDELGDGTAVLLGHDWGSPIAANTARLHPDKVSAIALLSVPYFPVGPDNSLDRWREAYTSKGRFFYQVWFDDNPGHAEAHLGADTLRSIRMIYYSASGDAADEPGFTADKSADEDLLDGLPDPDPFPAWCSPDDLQVFADGIDTGGWHGPLNRYRAQGLDAADIGQIPDGNLTQPSAFIGGEFDVVRRFSEELDPYDFAAMACDDFRGTTIIPGAGHWVQQEAPDATNQAIAAFLDQL